MEGGTTFHFVTGGIEEALGSPARRPATGTSRSCGGASTINQYLAAGYIDELRLHVAPVVLGEGEALFRDLPGLSFEVASSRSTSLVTHVTLRRGPAQSRGLTGDRGGRTGGRTGRRGRRAPRPVGGPVQQELRAELLGALAVSLQLVAARHREVQVQLHRYVVGRPGGALEALDLLDRQHPVLALRRAGPASRRRRRRRRAARRRAGSAARGAAGRTPPAPGRPWCRSRCGGAADSHSWRPRILTHPAMLTAGASTAGRPRDAETGRSRGTDPVRGSPGWTRTNNPPINSRMLCQLSYRGSLEPAQISKRDRGVANREPPRRSASVEADVGPRPRPGRPRRPPGRRGRRGRCPRRTRRPSCTSRSPAGRPSGDHAYAAACRRSGTCRCEQHAGRDPLADQLEQPVGVVGATRRASARARAAARPSCRPR